MAAVSGADKRANWGPRPGGLWEGYTEACPAVCWQLSWPWLLLPLNIPRCGSSPKGGVWDPMKRGGMGMV